MCRVAPSAARGLGLGLSQGRHAPAHPHVPMLPSWPPPPDPHPILITLFTCPSLTAGAACCGQAAGCRGIAVPRRRGRHLRAHLWRAHQQVGAQSHSEPMGAGARRTQWVAAVGVRACTSGCEGLHTSSSCCCRTLSSALLCARTRLAGPIHAPTSTAQARCSLERSRAGASRPQRPTPSLLARL